MIDEKEATISIDTRTKYIKVYGKDNRSIVSELLVIYGKSAKELAHQIADIVVNRSRVHIAELVGWHRARRLREFRNSGRIEIEGASKKYKLDFDFETVENIDNQHNIDIQQNWRFFVNWYNERWNGAMNNDRLVKMQLGLTIGYLTAKYKIKVQPEIELKVIGGDIVGSLKLYNAKLLDSNFIAGAAGLSRVALGAFVVWNTEMTVLWG